MSAMSSVSFFQRCHTFRDLPSNPYKNTVKPHTCSSVVVWRDNGSDNPDIFVSESNNEGDMAQTLPCLSLSDIYSETVKLSENSGLLSLPQIAASERMYFKKTYNL
jgi:hypothetical protein